MPRPFQFSLRTLALATLLIGSCGMLWWNWGPWVPSSTVAEDGAVLGVGFSPDARLFYAWYAESNFNSVISFYDSSTVQKVHSIRCGGGTGDWFQVSESGKFVICNIPCKNCSDPTIYSSQCLRIDTGKLVDFSKAVTVQPFNPIIILSAKDTFAALTLRYGYGTAIVKLPEMNVVLRCDPISYGKFSPDESWFAISEHDKIFVYSTADGKLNHTFTVESTRSQPSLAFTSDSARLAVAPGRPRDFWLLGDKLPDCVHLFDVRDGKQIALLSERDGSKYFERKPKYSPVAPDEYLKQLRNSESNEVVFEFSGFRASRELQSSRHILQFAKNDESFLTYADPFPPMEFLPHKFVERTSANSRFTLWKKLRPEQWWGVCVRIEFWLVIFLAATLLWSLLKDRPPRPSPMTNDK